MVVAGVRTRRRARRSPRGRSTGVFGIARTTGTPSGSLSLDARGRYRGRDGEDGLLGEDERPDLAEQPLDVLRLDGDDDERGAGRGVVVRERRLDPVAVAQLGDALGPARRRRDLRRLAPARRQQPGDERLADSTGAEDRDLARRRPCGGVYDRSLGCAPRGRAHLPCPIHARAGHEAALEPLEEVDAREPLPLVVRVEELRRLARLGPAPPHARRGASRARGRPRARCRSGRGLAARRPRRSRGRRPARARAGPARRADRAALRGRGRERASSGSRPGSRRARSS